MAETGVRTLKFSIKKNTHVPGSIEIRLHELYTFMRFLSVITKIIHRLAVREKGKNPGSLELND